MNRKNIFKNVSKGDALVNDIDDEEDDEDKVGRLVDEIEGEEDVDMDRRVIILFWIVIVEFLIIWILV